MKTIAISKLVLIYVALGLSSVVVTSLISFSSDGSNMYVSVEPPQNAEASVVTRVSASSTIITAGVAALDAGQGKASPHSLQVLEEALSSLKDAVGVSTLNSQESMFAIQQKSDRTELATSQVSKEIEAWNVEEANKADILNEAAPKVDYITRVRNQLDYLGGEDINIVWSENPCGIDWAKGCVFYPDVSQIVLSPEVSSLDEHSSYVLITHEYAHIVIGKMDPVDYLMKNIKLLEVFPAEPNVNETLADCMAEVITGNTTGTYLDSCTPEQLQIAQGVWDGSYPMVAN